MGGLGDGNECKHSTLPLSGLVSPNQSITPSGKMEM